MLMEMYELKHLEVYSQDSEDHAFGEQLLQRVEWLWKAGLT